MLDTFEKLAMIAGGLITLATLITLLVKPVKKLLYQKLCKPYEDLHQKLDQSDEAQLLGMMALMSLVRDRLYQSCKYFISEGEISTDDLQNLTVLYEGYTKLGGNGTCKELYERVLELKIK